MEKGMTDYTLEKEKFILKNTYGIFGVYGRIVDEAGRVVTAVFDSAENIDPVIADKTLLTKLKQKVLSAPEIRVEFDDEGFLYYGYLKKGRLYLLGPMLQERADTFHINLYLSHRCVTTKELFVPLIEKNRQTKIADYTFGLLTDDYKRSTLQELKPNDAGEYSFQRKSVAYGLSSLDAERQHFSYEREKEFFRKLVNGELKEFSEPGRSDEEDLEFIDMELGTGLMSRSAFKQAEYGFVGCMMLAVRYAIEAGANETEAYHVSDIALQELSMADSAEHAGKIFTLFLKKIVEVTAKGKKEREGGEYSLYIEKAKTYIARHIFQKIKLEDIAEDLSLNPAYLSRIFSKGTGMPLTEYILREKVQISCNLLRYSDRSILEISEYLNLMPQSYFTKVFKKYTGMTPARYRKEKSDAQFR